MLPDFRVRQRDYLREISRALTQELDLDKLLARILRIAVEMLAGQAGIIALKESSGWRVGTAHGIPAALLSYLEPLLAEERVAELDVVELNRMLKELTYTATLGLLNGTGLPLSAHGQVIGVIFIFRSYPDLFTANDRTLLQSFADQAAIAVFNAQLYGQISYEKQRLDALIDSAADGILILDHDHTVERCNLAFERLYGEKRLEIQGRGHSDVIRWARQPDGRTLEEAEAQGWPLDAGATLYVEGDLERPEPPGVVPGVRSAGSATPPAEQPSQPTGVVPVGITYAPLLNDEGRLQNIIVTVRDITRFRTAEEIKSTFISIISHELKTPVALIKGYASTLRLDDAHWDRAVVQESLAVIEEEADRLARMIEDLLDASRLQAGGLSLSRADVSLKRLAERQADRFRPQTDRHTIVVDFPENFPIILADETRIEQVIANLISNAIKYAPGGEIRISGRAQAGHVVVCARDEGPGIDTHDVPHIFDRFYRAEKAARRTKGAGLGLYLARAIIEAHGGRIWAAPQSETGAQICFSLPR